MRIVSLTLACAAVALAAGCGSSTSHTQSATGGTAVESPTTQASSATVPGHSPGAHGAASPSATTPGGRTTSGSPNQVYGSLPTFGREAGGNVRHAVLAAVHSYLGSIAAGDWAAACEQLSTPVKRQLARFRVTGGATGHSCPAALGALLGNAPVALRRQQARLSVVAVREQGDLAFVLYRSPGVPHGSISMLREAGQWKAGVLGATNVG